MLLENTDKILHMREENPITSIEATANIIKILVLLKQSQEEKNNPGTPEACPACLGTGDERYRRMPGVRIYGLLTFYTSLSQGVRHDPSSIQKTVFPDR